METGRSQVQQSRGEQPTDGRVVTAAEVLPEERCSESYTGPPVRGSFAGKGGPQVFSFEGQQGFLSGVPGAGANRSSTLEG